MLENTVTSIADQIEDRQIKIIVSDHGSTDETPEVLARLAGKYPFLGVVRLERQKDHDYSHNFRHVFGLPSSEWTWTFGDDDILLPKAIETIWPVLERDEFQFIHVAESKRCQNSGLMVKGSLLTLCNSIGWIDMTGFISCNVIRTSKLKSAANVLAWDLYAKNAFVQSCAILEVCKDDFSAFMDCPLVQSPETTDDTMARWAQFQVGLRYHYVDEALKYMREKAILGTVEPKFFRYLSYHLWDRFLTAIVDAYNTSENMTLTPYLEDLIERCVTLTTFLDPINEKRFREEVMDVKRSLIEHSSAFQYAIKKAGEMGRLMDYHGRERFPFEYVRK